METVSQNVPFNKTFLEFDDLSKFHNVTKNNILEMFDKLKKPTEEPKVVEMYKNQLSSILDKMFAAFKNDQTFKRLVSVSLAWENISDTYTQVEKVYDEQFEKEILKYVNDGKSGLIPLEINMEFHKKVNQLAI